MLTPVSGSAKRGIKKVDPIYYKVCEEKIIDGNSPWPEYLWDVVTNKSLNLGPPLSLAVLQNCLSPLHTSNHFPLHSLFYFPEKYNKFQLRFQGATMFSGKGGIQLNNTDHPLTIADLHPQSRPSAIPYSPEQATSLSTSELEPGSQRSLRQRWLSLSVQ